MMNQAVNPGSNIKGRVSARTAAKAPFTATERRCLWCDCPLKGKQESFCCDKHRLIFHNSKKLPGSQRFFLMEMARLDALSPQERLDALLAAAGKVGLIQ
jgi:hypothetical protein